MKQSRDAFRSFVRHATWTFHAKENCTLRCRFLPLTDSWRSSSEVVWSFTKPLKTYQIRYNAYWIHTYVFIRHFFIGQMHKAIRSCLKWSINNYRRINQNKLQPSCTEVARDPYSPHTSIDSLSLDFSTSPNRSRHHFFLFVRNGGAAECELIPYLPFVRALFYFSHIFHTKRPRLMLLERYPRFPLSWITAIMAWGSATGSGAPRPPGAQTLQFLTLFFCGHPFCLASCEGCRFKIHINIRSILWMISQKKKIHSFTCFVLQSFWSYFNMTHIHHYKIFDTHFVYYIQSIIISFKFAK